MIVCYTRGGKREKDQKWYGIPVLKIDTLNSCGKDAGDDNEDHEVSNAP